MKEILGGKIVTSPFILHLYLNASKVDRNCYVVLKYGVSAFTLFVSIELLHSIMLSICHVIPIVYIKQLN